MTRRPVRNAVDYSRSREPVGISPIDTIDVIRPAPRRGEVQLQRYICYDANMHVADLRLEGPYRAVFVVTDANEAGVYVLWRWTGVVEVGRVEGRTVTITSRRVPRETEYRQIADELGILDWAAAEGAGTRYRYREALQEMETRTPFEDLHTAWRSHFPSISNNVDRSSLQSIALRDTFSDDVDANTRRMLRELSLVINRTTNAVNMFGGHNYSVEHKGHDTARIAWVDRDKAFWVGEWEYWVVPPADPPLPEKRLSKLRSIPTLRQRFIEKAKGSALARVCSLVGVQFNYEDVTDARAVEEIKSKVRSKLGIPNIVPINENAPPFSVSGTRSAAFKGGAIPDASLLDFLTYNGIRIETMISDDTALRHELKLAVAAAMRQTDLALDNAEITFDRNMHNRTFRVRLSFDLPEEKFFNDYYNQTAAMANREFPAAAAGMVADMLRADNDALACVRVLANALRLSREADGTPTLERLKRTEPALAALLSRPVKDSGVIGELPEADAALIDYTRSGKRAVPAGKRRIKLPRNLPNATDPADLGDASGD